MGNTIDVYHLLAPILRTDTKAASIGNSRDVY